MIPNIKYKTSLCKNWLDSTLWLYEDERCPKASNCYFAHGDRDLRTIEEVRLLRIFSFFPLLLYVEHSRHGPQASVATQLQLLWRLQA